MKRTHPLSLPALVLGVALAGAAAARAQLADALVLQLSTTGDLTFPVVPGQTNYTVEWAPTVRGPWISSWEHLKQISPTGTNHTVQIPMFFRVRARGIVVSVSPQGMGYVPPGQFLMGDNFATSGDAGPVRSVTVSAFFVDRKEVTVALWNEVCAWALAQGYDLGRPIATGATNHPVQGIDWYDAVKWCNARSEMHNLDPVYFTDASHATVYRSGLLDLTNGDVDWTRSGYRLPTEAEWEKAARGALASQQYPWASGSSDYAAQITGDQANFWNSGDRYDNGTTPAGYYDGHQSVAGQNMANGLGLYDMAGNVSEMCWDWYGSYSPGAPADPRGPDSGDRRVSRGGSWYDGVFELRCATRRSFQPWVGASQRGFRCVRNVTP
jgi:formylglycine-generating enzyme required for sulfatase activity